MQLSFLQDFINFILSHYFLKKLVSFRKDIIKSKYKSTFFECKVSIKMIFMLVKFKVLSINVECRSRVV
jgi:hypothetical protein